MARVCAACYKGDHPDCTRWLMRDHPCTCVCDDAPRQLTLPWGIEEGSAGPAGAKRRPAPPAATEEAPF